MDSPVPTFGEEIKKEFMLEWGRVNLNHGSYGAMPRCVHEKQIQYLAELERNPDVWFRKSMNEYIHTAVQKVSEFIGTDPNDTFLLQNTTKAMNTVLKSFPLTSGDCFMITSLTYPAVKNTSRHTTSRKHGTATKHLDLPFPIESEEDVLKQYDEFLQQNPDIKLAIVDHITSPTAVLMPVKKLTEICHRHDVIVLIDGAHAPGLIDLDLNDIDADFYCGNLHKWVYCPRSCAFLWRNPNRAHDWLTPLITSAFHGNGLAQEFKYEGTKDDTPYICAAHGIDYYNRIGGREAILGYTTKLQKEGVAYLEERWGTKRLDVPESFVSPNQQLVTMPYIPYYTDNPEKQDELLMDLIERFSVTAMPRNINGVLMCRIMVQVYNTMDDFRRLADAVLTMSREKK